MLVHAVNASLVASFVFSLSRRRETSWLAGACFLASAVLTEAITGVVGIADVFGGLFVLAALVCLQRGLLAMPLCVFALVLLGLFSKGERARGAAARTLGGAAQCAAFFHPTRPLRALRGPWLRSARPRPPWWPTPISDAVSFRWCRRSMPAPRCRPQRARPRVR